MESLKGNWERGGKWLGVKKKKNFIHVEFFFYRSERTFFSLLLRIASATRGRMCLSISISVSYLLLTSTDSIYT